MTSPHASAAAPFGRVLTAMVTPFHADGSLDLDAAQKVASHLVDQGNDGLVISGTTGESATTTPDEDGDLLRAVLDAVGDRATIVAGVGNNDTAASCRLTRQAGEAGAHGVLLVSPYYTRPPQAGLVRHFRTVADAGDLPVMLYDVPGRTAVRIGLETFVEVASHERIVAVKDASGDLVGGSRMMAETGLALYSGDDGLTFPWLCLGAAGMVSVVGHVAARRYADMVAAFDAGDLATARAIHVGLLPVVEAIMGTEIRGAIASKAGLQALGVLAGRTTRSPLVDATDAQVDEIGAVLADAGLG